MKKILGILLLLSIFSVYAANNNILCSIEYFYSDDGMLIGKAINGNRINYEYDLRGQLLSVKNTNGKVLESYTYDKVGNILSKTVNDKTTTYTYDKANQLISSTTDGKTTNYKYDAAGRMIQAGSKTYRYKYLDKVAEVRENGKVIAEFEYTVEGQVSTATYGDKTEEFMWDGLSLIKRNDTSYINEPYITGGNPIIADNDVMFNDMLGNTVAINGKSIDMTAFGETENPDAMFTGKPHVAELGYAFLFRNYDSSLGKWSTSDPLGYPDGWNNFAYCNNWATTAIDKIGMDIYHVLASSAVGNFGHSAAIVGNEIFGYRILNHGSSIGIGANANNWQTTFNSVSEALRMLNSGRTGDDSFDMIQKWETSYAQDDIAYQKMLERASEDYDTFLNNCWQVVCAGILEAFYPLGNMYCSILPIPNSAFLANLANPLGPKLLDFYNVLLGIEE